MNTKLKNAPHLKEQPNKSLTDLIILAGSNAWAGWNKGDGIEWGLFYQAISHDNPKQKPVILGDKQLAELDRLRIAPKTQRAVKIAIFGELSQSHRTAICLNLAKYTQAETVQFMTSLGERDEDASAYIQRLRQDSEAAELITKSTIKEKELINLSDKPTQKQIAEAFLQWTKQPIGRDALTGEPLEYDGICWQQIHKHNFNRRVIDFYDEFNGDYTASKITAVADLITLKADEIPPQAHDLIGFMNGVLNKKTGEFTAHDIKHYLRGIEPFSCNTDSLETPLFDDWLDFVSHGNEDKKGAILSGFYMILTNRHEWGLFLEATGIAGAGKSVFGQIASIINGGENTAYISLQELEQDKKRAMLIGKSLAISPDQKPYKGSADELKAITGGDKITVKLNYINDFSTKLTPVFMLVTNYPLLFTDRNGGIMRRRVIIPFDRAIPKEKKDVKFIDKIQVEVYGIVNKLLTIFPNPDTARKILENYRDKGDSHGIKREANHLIDFLAHFEIKDSRKGGLRIGSTRRESINLHSTLYGAYMYYCDCLGLTPLNVLTFKNALLDAFKEAGETQEYSLKKYSGVFLTNVFWKNKDESIQQWEG